MVWAEHPLLVGAAVLGPDAEPLHSPTPSSPEGDEAAQVQGLRVVRAEDSLLTGQQF